MTANVAYDGTHADLGMGTNASFLSESADLSLFGDEMFSFTPINASLPSAPSTVSPKDLFMDSMSSVSSSSAFPDLTPASEMLATPDTSPWFNDLDKISMNENYAFPLFPEMGDESDFPDTTPAIKRSDSKIVIAEAQYDRKISSASASPALGVKMSTTAGVRKRQKPLPAIIVDKEDPVAVKRARNTAAARKSRERKELHRDTLETRIAELEALCKQKDDEIAALKAKDSYGLSQLSTF